MLGEPCPEVAAEHVGEDGLSARVEPLDRAVPDASEEDGEIVPAARQQELGRRGVAEDAPFLLGEDALARERTEEPMKGVRVGAGFTCEVLDRPGSCGEGLWNPEAGDDPKRARRERATQNLPDRELGGDLAHGPASGP